jgi:hypothetical protein
MHEQQENGKINGNQNNMIKVQILQEIISFKKDGDDFSSRPINKKGYD